MPYPPFRFLKFYFLPCSRCFSNVVLVIGFCFMMNSASLHVLIHLVLASVMIFCASALVISHLKDHIKYTVWLSLDSVCGFPSFLLFFKDLFV